MTNYEPTPLNIHGSDLSGTDGQPNRTYTLPGTATLSDAIMINVQGVPMQSTDFTFVTSTRIITFLNGIDDFMVIDGIYFLDNTITVTGTFAEKVRYKLIQENDTTILSDTLIGVYKNEAAELQGSTDETAWVNYVCYMIAQEWDSIMGVKSHEGVSYERPDPEKFLSRYEQRLKVLNRSNSSVLMAKVSTNKNLQYNSTTSEMEERYP